MEERWAEERKEERRLWRLWQGTGDPAYREAILLAYWPMVSGLTKRFFGSGWRWSRVEDCFADARVLVIELFDRFEPERSADPAPHFRGIVAGEVCRYLRRERGRLIQEDREGPLSLDVLTPGKDGKLSPLADIVADPRADTEAAALGAATPRPSGFLRALQCLSRRDRQIVLLLFEEDRSIRHARQVLRCSEGRLREERDRLLCRLRYLWQKERGHG